MNKVIYLLFFVALSSFSQQIIKGQSILFRSTITSVGSSSMSIGGKNSILQSVGQSSIIGKKDINTLSVQQGFLTNSIFYNIDNSKIDNFKELLDLVIFPNPFIDYININFSRKTIYNIFVEIFDMNGKIVFTKKYPASEKIVVPIMKRIAMGNYMLTIRSGNNNYSKKIIKIE